MTARPLAATLAKLHGEATPGPWKHQRDEDRGYLDGIQSGATIYGAPGRGIVGYAVGETDEDANSALIVTLRNAGPLLIAALQLCESVDDMERRGDASVESAMKCDALLSAFRRARAASLGGDE